MTQHIVDQNQQYAGCYELLLQQKNKLKLLLQHTNRLEVTFAPEKKQLQVTFAADKQATSYFCTRKTSYKLLLHQKNPLLVTFAAEKQRRLLACVGNCNKSQSSTVKLHLLVSQHQTDCVSVSNMLTSRLSGCLQICMSVRTSQTVFLLLLITFT